MRAGAGADPGFRVLYLQPPFAPTLVVESGGWRVMVALRLGAESFVYTGSVLDPIPVSEAELMEVLGPIIALAHED